MNVWNPRRVHNTFSKTRGGGHKNHQILGGEAFPWMCQEYFAHMVIDAWLTTFDFQKKEKVAKLNFLSGGGIWTSRGRRVSRMQRKSLETWELLGGILWLRPSLLNLFTLTRAFQVFQVHSGRAGQVQGIGITLLSFTRQKFCPPPLNI